METAQITRCVRNINSVGDVTTVALHTKTCRGKRVYKRGFARATLYDIEWDGSGKEILGVIRYKPFNNYKETRLSGGTIPELVIDLAHKVPAEDIEKRYGIDEVVDILSSSSATTPRSYVRKWDKKDRRAYEVEAVIEGKAYRFKRRGNNVTVYIKEGGKFVKDQVIDMEHLGTIDDTVVDLFLGRNGSSVALDLGVDVRERSYKEEKRINNFINGRKERAKKERAKKP